MPTRPQANLDQIGLIVDGRRVKQAEELQRHMCSAAKSMQKWLELFSDLAKIGIGVPFKASKDSRGPITLEMKERREKINEIGGKAIEDLRKLMKVAHEFGVCELETAARHIADEWIKPIVDSAGRPKNFYIVEGINSLFEETADLVSSIADMLSTPTIWDQGEQHARSTISYSIGFTFQHYLFIAARDECMPRILETMSEIERHNFREALRTEGAW